MVALEQVDPPSRTIGRLFARQAISEIKRRMTRLYEVTLDVVMPLPAAFVATYRNLISRHDVSGR